MYTIRIFLYETWCRGPALEQTPCRLHWRIFRNVSPHLLQLPLPIQRSVNVAGAHPNHTNWRAYQSECLCPLFTETIMSETLQFGEMAAWLSISEACPNAVLSSCLPTVSAHTLQLCEPAVLRSPVWVGTGVSCFITSHHSPAKDQRQNHYDLLSAKSRHK